MPPTQATTTGAGLGVEPAQLALHLQGEFARRRDRQGERSLGGHALVVAQQDVGQREAEGDGLARAGLRRHDEIAPESLGGEDGGLHGCGFVVAVRGEGARKWCGQRRKRQIVCFWFEDRARRAIVPVNARQSAVL